MNPRELVARALEVGLDVLALCDHNSAENVSAVIEAATGTGLTVLPGIEFCSREEVHVVAVFPDVESALAAGLKCRETLALPNRPEIFGMQVRLDAAGNVLGFEDRLLAQATTWSVEEVCRMASSLGALVALAHVDREAFGILGQLGFIPAGLPFHAVEVTSRDGLARIRPVLGEALPLIASSDAHRLAELGLRYSLVDAEDGRFEALSRAVRTGRVEVVLP
jgi:hypothetical protein